MKVINCYKFFPLQTTGMVRVKKRYLVVKIQFDETKRSSYQQEDIYYSIRQSIRHLYGDFGDAIYSEKLVVKYLNPHTSIFFLQCLRDHYKQTRAAVSFVTVVNKQRCALTCLKAAATIKLAERFLLNYNIKGMGLMYSKCKTLGEKKKMVELMEEFSIPYEDVNTDV